jgi:hypothetical protein
VLKKTGDLNMSDDLVERLRAEGIAELDEAADRIEKLDAALREITWIATPDHEEARHKATEIARKALEGKND